MVVRWPFRAGIPRRLRDVGRGPRRLQTHDPRSCATVDSNGTIQAGFNGLSAVSADGRYVSFTSNASGFVSGDTNSYFDVFVHDRVTGATVRVSVDSNGVQGDGPSVGGALSADGRFVAFAGDATNLVAGDSNGLTDVFVHDRDPDGNGILTKATGSRRASACARTESRRTEILWSRQSPRTGRGSRSRAARPTSSAATSTTDSTSSCTT
jgi:Tol biopolymer transport system component